jgi:hypothetical protein
VPGGDECQRRDDHDHRGSDSGNSAHDLAGRACQGDQKVPGRWRPEAPPRTRTWPHPRIGPFVFSQESSGKSTSRDGGSGEAGGRLAGGCCLVTALKDLRDLGS